MKPFVTFRQQHTNVLFSGCAGIAESQIGRELEHVPHTGEVVLDFCRVPHLNSMDVGAIMGFRGRVVAHGGTLKLVNLAGLAREVLKITKVDTILDIV